MSGLERTKKRVVSTLADGTTVQPVAKANVHNAKIFLMV